jgi:hypothetical protein
VNGQARTGEAAGLATRTARHFAHKVPVTKRDGATAIETRYGVAVLRAEGDLLAIELEPVDDDALPRLRAVIEEHLQRFAREPLAIAWAGPEREARREV